MTILRCYNMTKGAAAFPGCTGTLATGTARNVVVEEMDYDVFAYELLVRGPAMGIAALELDSFGMLPSFVGVAQGFQERATSGALGTATRAAVLTANSVAATLMAASAVPATTLVRVLLDHTYAAGIVTGSVARAGADTINGAATAITLTPSSPLVTLRSDGVSAWVTL